MQSSSLVAVLVVALAVSGSRQQDCSRIEYDRCVRVADPLVKEAHLVFPDNVDDIDTVCRTWNKFVDCLKRFTDRCFTDQQRRQFNKAVENPIESVHQMCMQPAYQKEYLQHAPCIKSTITKKIHCGQHYSLLVDQVAQGEIISKATLCCSHDRFKQCVQREARRLCDHGVPDGPASRFSGQILDKALSFLQDQCFNYIPNSGDCVAPSSDYPPFTDPIMISTAPSEVFPWSTIQENNNNVAPKEIPSSRISPPRPSTAWLPSSPSPNSQSDYGYQTDPSTQILGSRTRPASYGRSSSWGADQSNVPPSPYSTPNVPSTAYGSDNTVRIYSASGGLPSSSSSPRPDWATVSTWNVVNRNSPGAEATSSGGQPTQETWYPAAGNQISNEVDEPNQQGLSYGKGGNGAGQKRLLSITLVATVLTAIC